MTFAPPSSLGEIEASAREVLPPEVAEWIAGGSGREVTLGRNLRAFEEAVLHARVLQVTKAPSLSGSCLGQEFPTPLFVCPMGGQGLVHPDAEPGACAAAEAERIIFTIATNSTFSMEEISTRFPTAPRWFQLYPQREETITRDLLRRAAACGCTALVVTVDAPVSGPRRSSFARAGFAPGTLRLGNLEKYPVPTPFSSWAGRIAAHPGDPKFTWEDLGKLREWTELPVVVKGITDPRDALRAVEVGARGLIVSNHGGRQLDGVPSSLQSLTEVVSAVGSQVDVMVDGGVRRGTDILVALALGARMVGIGRPLLWGLASGGSEGARWVLHTMIEEFKDALMLIGCPDLGHFPAGAVKLRAC